MMKTGFRESIQKRKTASKIFWLSLVLSFFASACELTEKEVEKVADPVASVPTDDVPADSGNDQPAVQTTLDLFSPSNQNALNQSQQSVTGSCDESLGDVVMDGDFLSAPDFVACLDGEFSHVVDFQNLNAANDLSITQGEGDQQVRIEAEYELFVLGPYCGDGQVNQVWEICDGDESCDEMCQSDEFPHPSSTKLAKVTLDEVYYENDAAIVQPYVFLGEKDQSIPVDAWFALQYDGLGFVDQDTNVFKDVPGLVVQRQADKNLKLLFPSAVDSDDLRHAQGEILFHNTSARSFSLGSGNEALENGTDGLIGILAGNDEVRRDGGEIFYFLVVTTADDAFLTRWR